VSDTDLPDVAASRGALSVGLFDAREQDSTRVDCETLCRLTLDLLHGEGVASGRLDLHLVEPEEMARLNVEHLGSSGPTDVLSFPLDAEGDPLFGDDERMLGDLVLCPSVASEQAATHVGTLEGELALLTIHGALHLLGHDHFEEAERIEMQAKERRYLASCGYAHPVSP
jgi:probable rRNA maturation factor